jgi:hypothetical protein
MLNQAGDLSRKATAMKDRVNIMITAPAIPKTGMVGSAMKVVAIIMTRIFMSRRLEEGTKGSGAMVIRMMKMITTVIRAGNPGTNLMTNVITTGIMRMTVDSFKEQEKSFARCGTTGGEMIVTVDFSKSHSMRTGTSVGMDGTTGRLMLTGDRQVAATTPIEEQINNIQDIKQTETMATTRAKKSAKKSSSRKQGTKASAKKAPAKKRGKTSARKETKSDNNRSESGRQSREEMNRQRIERQAHEGNVGRQLNRNYTQWEYGYNQQGQHAGDLGHRPPQAGYVPANVAHYMVEQNSGSNPGGRSYGQSYGSHHQGGGGFQQEGNWQQDYGRHNGQQDEFAGQRASGDSFAQTYGQHRREQDFFNERDRDEYDRRDGQQRRYEERQMHGYPEEPRFRRESERYGDNDNRFRGQNEYGPDARAYGNPREWRGNDHPQDRQRDEGYYREDLRERGDWDDRRNNDPTEYEYQHGGYQAQGEVQGFGFRKSRRHQGGWLGEEEYRGGHAQSRRGRGKYGSR